MRKTKLMKERRINKWRDIPCSWTRTLTIVKMSLLPNLICRFHCNPNQNPSNLFVDINKLALKFISKRPRIHSVVKEQS